MGQKAGGLKVQYNPQQARQQWQNRVNNAQGHIFEDGIKAACQVYHGSGRAEVDKTPEPFRVMEKHRDGTFTGRFTARAAPDFQGTLQGGRSIVFEAKYTTTDKLKRAVVTDAQMSALESHSQSGAAAGVCRDSGQIFSCAVGDMAGHESAFWACVRFGGRIGAVPREIYGCGAVSGLCTYNL